MLLLSNYMFLTLSGWQTAHLKATKLKTGGRNEERQLMTEKLLLSWCRSHLSVHWRNRKWSDHFRYCVKKKSFSSCTQGWIIFKHLIKHLGRLNSAYCVTLYSKQGYMLCSLAARCCSPLSILFLTQFVLHYFSVNMKALSRSVWPKSNDELNENKKATKLNKFILMEQQYQRLNNN